MNDHSINNEKILEQTENSVTIEYLIPASSDLFDGHFPEFKLLPAVGQFENITRFAKKYFKVARWTPSIRRMKFSAPVRPDTLVKMELSYNKEKSSVTFKLSNSKNPDIVYSSGMISTVSE